MFGSLLTEWFSVQSNSFFVLIFVTDRIIFGNLIFWGVKKTEAYYYNKNFDQNNIYERIY